MASRSPSPPFAAGIPPTLSLQGCLAQALSPVVARAMSACGYDSPFPPSTERAAPLPPLRFSRDRQDIAYLYRPSLIHPSIPRPSTDRPSAKSGAIPTGLTAALVAQWTNLSSATRLKTVGAGSPCLGKPRTDNPDLALDSPNQASLAPDSLILADWETYLSAHTTAQALPSGQLLLRPRSTALGTWLWAFTRACPAPPRPAAAAALPFPQKQAPLAEALHLSPLALLQYTHMRCHLLAHRCQAPPPSSPQTTDSDLADWLTALLPHHPTGQRLLRSLIALVDHLAAHSPETPTPIPPQDLNQGFMKGYHLCEAADLWLRDMVGQPQTIGITLLMQGSAQGLAHLLQGWLQAKAPTHL